MESWGSRFSYCEEPCCHHNQKLTANFWHIYLVVVSCQKFHAVEQNGLITKLIFHWQFPKKVCWTLLVIWIILNQEITLVTVCICLVDPQKSSPWYFSIFKTTCEYWQEDWFGSSKRRKFLPEIWMSRTSRWKVTVEKMLIIYTLAYLEFMPIKMRIGRRWRSTPILWPTLNHCALLQFACLVV